MLFRYDLYVIAFRRGSPLRSPACLTPLPVGNFRHVLTVLGDVLLVLKQLVVNRLFGIGGAGAKFWQPINDVAEDANTIGLSFVKSASKSRSDRPCGCSLWCCSFIKLTTLMTRIFSVGRY